MEKVINHIGLIVSTSLEARETPAVKPLLHKDESSLGRKFIWNYRTAVGMLNYLQRLTRTEISMAVHQRAHFGNNPRLMYKRSVRRIANYLASTYAYVDLPDGY